MLEKPGVTSIMRVAPAYKVPLEALDIVRQYEQEPVVFITVAGRRRHILYAAHAVAVKTLQEEKSAGIDSMDFRVMNEPQL